MKSANEYYKGTVSRDKESEVLDSLHDIQQLKTPGDSNLNEDTIVGSHNSTEVVGALPIEVNDADIEANEINNVTRDQENSSQEVQLVAQTSDENEQKTNKQNSETDKGRKKTQK